MNRRIIKITIPIITLIAISSICCGDTFENIESGKVFHGFPTQKVKQGLTIVYNDNEKQFDPIRLSDYRITPDAKGRRDNVVIISLIDREVLISKSVSDSIIDSIVDASNKGPRLILLEIDLPGGRGDYTKNLADAVSNTKNCPIVAFIAGGATGGAYSAAFAVALACDKIYISRNAVIASDAPVPGIDNYYGNDFPEVFNSSSLSAYKGFFSTLADTKGRSATMAMALIDSYIEVVEVSDANGKKTFINKVDRLPAQTVVKTWSDKKLQTVTATMETPTATTGQFSIILTPSDAVYAKMADAIVESRNEILTDMDLTEAKLTYKNTTLNKNIKKFIATRRNLNEIVTNIDYLQRRADDLEIQLNDFQKQGTTSVETIEDDSYISKFDRSFEDRVAIQRRASGRDVVSQRSSQSMQAEITTETGLSYTIDELLDELAFVLIDLTRDYNKAIVLGRRFPGALPFGVTVSTLEKNLDSAEALYDDVLFRR
ncbi:MAG: hypothetical protein JW912_05770 [Sedimentisphaerales bacterium]|nr:hypothetical protein [Sedimentisphaerales bacterium]